MIKKPLKQIFVLLLIFSLCLTAFPESAPAAQNIPLTEEDSEDFGSTEDNGIGDYDEPSPGEKGDSDQDTLPADSEEPIYDQSEEESAGDPEQILSSPEEDPADPANNDTELSDETGSEEIFETEPAYGSDADIAENTTDISAEPFTVTLSKTSYTYKGKRIKPVVTVTTASGPALVKDTDYTVSYRNNLNVGKASVVVTGTGKYTGTVKKTFRIKACAIQNLTLKYKTMKYTGKSLTQTKTTVVTANPGGKQTVLTYGTDYTLGYSNNKNVGTALLTVTGTGNYKGTLTEEFSIVPAPAVLESLTAGTRRITVKWEKQDVQTSGYQIQYSRDKDFTDPSQVQIGKNSTVSKTLTGIKVGKTYYVRIRTYKDVDGVLYSSSWSEAKTIKLKYNTVSVTGSKGQRTVIIHNPKSVTDPSVAVWSKTGGQDDLLWHSFEKKSDGSWQAVISAAYLSHYGTCYAHVYNGSSFIGEKVFNISKKDFNAAADVIDVSGDGVMSRISLLRPSASYKKVRAAVWSAANGQDDLAWYSLVKQSGGSWCTESNLTSILHTGTVYVHIYADSAFIGEKTFTVNFGMEPCSSEEEYIEKIAPAVQRVCKKYGYLPSVLIAQSCLENGYGIPGYWDNPEISGLMYYNNMVGLKSELLSSSWSQYTVWGGKSIVKKTPEVYDGKQVIITDSFRVYDSIEQSFADFALFLTYASNYGSGGTPKYGPSVMSIKDPQKLIKAVASRGYATGPTYADSVMRIIKKHNLTKYDNLKNVKPTEYGP